jgi:SAM-dependent methyltransferase
MTRTSRHDAWRVGDSYDHYMGRWSRQIAPRFLDWLDAPSGLDWLEVGCGTGALSAAILALRNHPRSLLAIDQSEGFIAAARLNVPDQRAEFQLGDAQALPAETASKDVAVSALVLNFVPSREKALAEMKRVARPRSIIGFYVWDYPGGGVEFLHAFWNAAVSLDRKARDLAEDRRFPFCTSEELTGLARRAGLDSVECAAIEIPTVFKDFEDYWGPFTLGAGPAPGYCMNLDARARQRLKEELHDRLPRGGNGSISLQARAWAVRAKVG